MNGGEFGDTERAVRRRAIQYPAEVYASPGYLTRLRLLSFGYQLEACVKTGCRTFLEVGIGSGVLVQLLKRMGMTCLSADPDGGTHPNVVGALPNLPLKTGSFEVVACFEVLEHLPLSLLKPSLEELHRLSSRFVLISLPDQRRYCQVSIRMPLFSFVGLTGWPWGSRRDRGPVSDSHYWEIGMDGLGTSDIIAMADAAGLRCIKHYRCFEKPYWHFFTFRTMV